MDMPRARPPFVYCETSRHGKRVWYFRRGKGKRVRLPDLGTPAFEEAYQSALANKAPQRPVSAHPGTMAWLVDEFRKSAHWRNLKPSTRQIQEYILLGTLKTAGHVQASKITTADINRGIDRRAPHSGQSFRKMMNILFKWAVSVGYLDSNPAEAAQRVNIKSDGHHTWTIDEVERYRARWPIGTRERLALEMLLFTGLRRGDVYRVGRQHVKDGAITIRTEKTGVTIHAAIWTDLQAAIDAAPTGDLTFLTTSHGLPFKSGSSFGHWFANACRAAGVPGRAHGLRKCGATIAAENGANSHELMAMYGWARLTQAELYTRKAGRIALSRSASERIANAMPRTFNSVRDLGEKS